MNIRKLSLSLAAVASLGACAAMPGNPFRQASVAALPESDLIAGSHKVIDAMMARRPEIGTGVVLVTPLVDVDDTQSTSTIGRVVSEQLATRLTQNGAHVIEARTNESAYAGAAHGVFLLSERVTDIAKQNNAASVLVGTYGVVQGMAYVSTRIVAVEGGGVLASDDFVVTASGLSVRDDAEVGNRYGDESNMMLPEADPASAASLSGRRRITR